MSEGTERDPAIDAGRDGGYRAVVERYRDEPNQCTIFPVDADETETVTTWVTAKEPSFVDLWVVR
jgi:hypothetical protein